MDIVFDTPAPSRDNFVGYFYENDSTLNIQSELIFSVLGRYNCFAGCKVCYTQKHFNEALPKFFNFVPTVITSDMEQKWFNIFDHFSVVSNVDDIFWMKHQRPYLYDWYKIHSHRFQWGNMTDNNFIRSQPLFINELAPETRIQEISFSSEWLEKVDAKDIISMLDNLHKRNTVNKIKFILADAKDIEIDSVAKIWNWVNDREIRAYCSHHDFRGETKKLDSIIPQAEHMASDNSDIYTICREANYLMNTEFFLTLIESIGIDNKPYYAFKEFDVAEHLSAMIQGKIDLYTKWVNRYDAGGVKRSELTDLYFDYFRWVINNVSVNKNYNFVPIDLLNAKHRYYYKMVEAGWTVTDYGLFKNNTGGVVPLLEVKHG